VETKGKSPRKVATSLGDKESLHSTAGSIELSNLNYNSDESESSFEVIGDVDDRLRKKVMS